MKVFVLHGCPSNIERAMDPETRTYDKHWIPWLKDELNKRGIDVETPLMPNPWAPNYEAFKTEFEKFSVSKDDILIGHSCGCAFLVRWLGETKQKIQKLILVAPWKVVDSGNDIQKAFYEFPIDEDIKSRVNEIIMFTADDEEPEGKKSLKMYEATLGGNVMELKGHGHFTTGDMGTTEFPELLEEVLN